MLIELSPEIAGVAAAVVGERHRVLLRLIRTTTGTGV
jgi:hypothetical protein